MYWVLKDAEDGSYLGFGSRWTPHRSEARKFLSREDVMAEHLEPDGDCRYIGSVRIVRVREKGDPR